MNEITPEQIAALRTEIGPPTDRDHKWQPMVSAGEVRALLDMVERLTAERDEWAEEARDAGERCLEAEARAEKAEERVDGQAWEDLRAEGQRLADEGQRLSEEHERLTACWKVDMREVQRLRGGIEALAVEWGRMGELHGPSVDLMLRALLGGDA